MLYRIGSETEETGNAERDRTEHLILNSYIVKRVYRFALVNLIGLVGAVGSMVSVWTMYFTGNRDWLVPFVIFGLITWFYIEVVAPKSK